MTESTDSSSEFARSTPPESAHRDNFSTLYARWAPALMGWANLRIHPSMRTAIDPEDIVQEVWWRAMEGFDTFDRTKGDFRPWLFRIATNVLFDAFRRARSGRGLEARHPQVVEHFPEERIAELTSISLKVSRDETVHEMIAAVRAMEEEDRFLFVHCFLEGLTAREGAGLVGLSEAAALKRLQRLKSRLRASPTWNSFLFDD